MQAVCLVRTWQRSSGEPPVREFVATTRHRLRDSSHTKSSVRCGHAEVPVSNAKRVHDREYILSLSMRVMFTSF